MRRSDKAWQFTARNFEFLHRHHVYKKSARVFARATNARTFGSSFVWKNSSAGQRSVHIMHGAKAREPWLAGLIWTEQTNRTPKLLLRLSGSFLLRFAARQLDASLFQLPPRLTRFEPLRPLPTAILHFDGVFVQKFPAQAVGISQADKIVHTLHRFDESVARNFAGQILFLPLPELRFEPLPAVFL